MTLLWPTPDEMALYFFVINVGLAGVMARIDYSNSTLFAD
jgi:hypothetical protein